MGSTSRISHLEPEMSQSHQGVPEWAAEMVDAQPLSSLCAVFAAGFVVGVGVVSVAVASTSRPPTRLKQAEHFTNRIAEAVSNALPKNFEDLWPR